MTRWFYMVVLENGTWYNHSRMASWAGQAIADLKAERPFAEVLSISDK